MSAKAGKTGDSGGTGPGTAADVTPEMSYEAARAELREIVATLESGGQGLEESLALWERGEQLADLCQRWLDVAGERLDAAIAARDEGESAGD